MPDLDKLRDLTEQVRPPSFASLAGTARRRDRRVAALAAGCAAVLVTVLGGALLQRGDERSAPQPARPAPDASADVRAVPRSGETSLPRGRYSLRVTPTLGYEVDVPARRYVDDGTFLHHPDAPGVFLVTAAPADGTLLPRNPCTDKSGVAVGPTPRSLARRCPPSRSSTSARPARSGSTAPPASSWRCGCRPDFDATACQDVGETEDDLMLFSTTEGSTWTWGPGYVGHWWILDVEGERVVVMNACDQDVHRQGPADPQDDDRVDHLHAGQPVAPRHPRVDPRVGDRR